LFDARRAARNRAPHDRGFPDRLREWRAAQEYDKASEEKWKSEVRDAQKRGVLPPMPPAATAVHEPESPRLRQHDTTIEKVASLLCYPAPKGLLIVRDELAGWIEGMTNYNDAGRQFWLEAYGGRPYRVERQKLAEPIIVPRLGVAVSGGIQPEKLAALMRGPDDGLLARILWLWPDPIPFEISRHRPGAGLRRSPRSTSFVNSICTPVSRIARRIRSWCRLLSRQSRL
jgi:hypothetical protein